MAGDLKQDDTISSLNQDIKEEQGKKEKSESTVSGEIETHGCPESDIQKYIGTDGAWDSPETAFLFGDALPHHVSPQQAGMMVAALEWSIQKIKEHWDELSWGDAAILTVMENQLMNIKLQQKKIKGEKDGSGN